MVYSPYYAISIRASTDRSTLQVLTNGSLHQVATRVNRSDTLLDQWQEDVREGYHYPYRLLKNPPKRALVLGRHRHDVAVLLDEGAEEIDAVEIDPMIIKMGSTTLTIPTHLQRSM